MRWAGISKISGIQGTAFLTLGSWNHCARCCGNQSHERQIKHDTRRRLDSPGSQDLSESNLVKHGLSTIDRNQTLHRAMTWSATETITETVSWSSTDSRMGSCLVTFTLISIQDYKGKSHFGPWQIKLFSWQHLRFLPQHDLKAHKVSNMNLLTINSTGTERFVSERAEIVEQSEVFEPRGPVQ